MKLYYPLGLIALLLLTSKLSIAQPQPTQASSQIKLHPSVTYVPAYYPPRRGLPGRREGAGTR